jgi:hypothetical protein
MVSEPAQPLPIASPRASTAAGITNIGADRAELAEERDRLRPPRAKIEQRATACQRPESQPP